MIIEFTACIEDFLGGKVVDQSILRKAVAHLQWYTLNQEAKVITIASILNLPDSAAKELNDLADKLAYPEEIQIDPAIEDQLGGESGGTPIPA